MPNRGDFSKIIERKSEYTSLKFVRNVARMFEDFINSRAISYSDDFTLHMSQNIISVLYYFFAPHSNKVKKLIIDDIALENQQAVWKFINQIERLAEDHQQNIQTEALRCLYERFENRIPGMIYVKE